MDKQICPGSAKEPAGWDMWGKGKCPSCGKFVSCFTVSAGKYGTVVHVIG